MIIHLDRIFVSAFSLLAATSLAVAQNAAPPPPNASQVANEIGQTVQFQDEVKAVSYSKSTQGYYLSFGAPYPKQILSVWIDRLTYDLLPGRGTKVGRIVRITGQLEQSPTGPLIKLQRKEDFRLRPVDESALSKPTLDGKQDREQFRAAVKQTFVREDFDTLEMLGQELRQSHERLNDGSWLSEAFFSAFRIKCERCGDAYAQTYQRLTRWGEKKPGSTLLPMINAGYHLDLAWKWRGDGYADTVAKEGWEGFRGELAVARQILENNPSEKAYPEYYALMQTVALGQGWPKEKFMALFTEATGIEPDYYNFYFKVAHYLLPRWHGEKGEWEQFAEMERQRRGAGGAGDGLYARIAFSMRDYYPNVFRDSAISWDVAASGFEYLIREHPQSQYLKSLYANLCWKNHDRARLRKALGEMSEPDMTVWVNLENVSLAEKFAGVDAAR